MFGKNKGTPVPPDSNSEAFYSVLHMLNLADAAYTQCEYAQAAHLYLAAFSAEAVPGASVSDASIEGLKRAWDAALNLKDRALAEHIFEKLEPYISGDEIAEHTEALQRLALDKLEEFGFSRDDLQDMADMVAKDFAGVLPEASNEAFVSQVFTIDNTSSKPIKGVLPWPRQNEHHASEQAQHTSLVPEENTTTIDTPDSQREKEPHNPEDFFFSDLVGYDRAIAEMKKKGIGLSNDQSFVDLLHVLRQRHGIDSLPSFKTLLFTSVAHEDANQFMLATAKEIGAPSVRMFMEDTPMGYPVLCVMATSDFKINPARGGFYGAGALLLEDIDLWGIPFSNSIEDEEDIPSYSYLSRGAREAVMFIRSAVENPEVTVMATCSSESSLDDFFIDLLSPLSVIEVDLPDESERLSVWKDVFSLYPSLRSLESNELVRLSANLSRNDIYLAARESVDQAFQDSISQRQFVPVTRDNLYNKIASFQPLDSNEYQELEENLVENFRIELDHVDDLLKGTE